MGVSVARASSSLLHILIDNVEEVEKKIISRGWVLRAGLTVFNLVLGTEEMIFRSETTILFAHRVRRQGD